MKKNFSFIFMMLVCLVQAVTIHVVADYAVPEEDVIEYTGSVHAVIEGEGIELWSDRLVVEKIGGDWNLVKAYGKVLVSMEDLQATSDELSYRMDTRRGTMSGSVTINVPDENVLIISDRVDFDRESEVYTGSSERLVEIIRDDVTLYSEEFEYRRKESKLLLKGSVKAVQVRGEDSEKKEISLTGDRAVIDTKENEAVFEGRVNVVYAETEATCDRLTYDMKSKGKLEGNVETLIKPQEEGEKEIEINSDVLEFDTEKDWYAGHSTGGRKVKIVRGSSIVYTREFEYFRNENKVILTGGVEIEDTERNVVIKASKAVIYTDKERMELWEVKMDIKR